MRLAQCALALWLLLCAAPAGAVSFTQLADDSLAVAGWSSYTQFGPPDLDGGLVAFFAYDYGAGFQGIYTASAGGPVTTIADLTTVAPGASGPFEALGGSSVSQGTVTFVGEPVGAELSVYTASGGSLTLLADDTTLDPDGSGTLLPYYLAPAIDGANVAFRATDENGFAGIYTSVGGVLETSVDETTSIPGGSGNLILDYQGPPVLDGTQVAFEAYSESGTAYGIYVADGGVARVVADLTTPIPGGTGNFTLFDEVVSIDDGNVVFLGRGEGYQDDYFAEIAGVLVQISAGESDMLAASIDGETVAYHAIDAGVDAIYVVRDGVSQRIIGSGDVLDGKVVNGLAIGANALSGDQLAFTAYFNLDDHQSDAIYLATIPEPGSGLQLATGLAALAALAARRRRVTRQPRSAGASRAGDPRELSAKTR
jgi:MYXO-CTERM domain-containing protein